MTRSEKTGCGADIVVCSAGWKAYATGVVSWLACLCILTIAAGCSGRRRADYSELNLADVRGTVRLDGQPLPDARVVFEADDTTFSYATTDSSGRYRLMYNSEQSGVKPGRKTVRITMLPSGEEEGGERIEEAGEVLTVGAESIPSRYNSRSKLTVQIESGNHTFDFDLTSSP